MGSRDIRSLADAEGMGSETVSPVVAEGCRGSDATGDRPLLDKIEDFWECQSYFRYSVYGGGPAIVVSLVILVVLIVCVKRCRKSASHAKRMRRSPLPIRLNVISEEQDGPGHEQKDTDYVENEGNIATVCEDYMVPYQNNFTNSGDRDPKYINVTGVSLGHGHVVRMIPAEDDAVSLPDQLLCGCGRNRAIPRGTSSKHYMNVSSPLGSISAQDIRSAGYGKDSNLDNSTNDLDSRNAHDMAPFSSKSEDTMTSCDSRYMNMKKSLPNYGHWGISRHSCPLKRPFNKDSLYDEVGTRHVDDDVYVPPQSCICNGENGHSMEATSSTKMQYMNVPNPLMSISSEDIRNIRYVEGSNCYHCTNDLKSRSAQDIRLNSHAGNSQGSGTSVLTNDSLLQTPVKPGYNVAVVEKRPYEKHGCSDSELSQKPPIININSVYEDVRCDGAATDTALYAGLEYSTSNLGRGKSEDVDCDIYDNTCAVTHNTQFPSPKCRAPIKDKHGCSNSACNKISPNTSFIYDDVISDEAVKDDRVYVNVDSSQSPSKSDRVNSDGSNCELYDDTCTIAGNRNLPPQISKAPNDEETYGEVYVTQEHLDRKVGRLIQFWSPHREAGNEPEYLTVLAN